MSPLRIIFCITLFTSAIASAEPASAQMYYGTTYTAATPVTLLPAPNYVVYSPNYMAWRSAGYYGGNWGPYYYNPQAMYPYTPGNAIWPHSLPAYPPTTRYYYR